MLSAIVGKLPLVALVSWLLAWWAHAERPSIDSVLSQVTPDVIEQPPQDFPSSCAAGRLDLVGRYVVRSRISIAGSCSLHAKANVKIELSAPLQLKGNATFFGHFAFSAAAPIDGSCIEVIGDVLVPENTTVTFEGCSSTAALPPGLGPVERCLGKRVVSMPKSTTTARAPVFLRSMRRARALAEIGNGSIPRPPPFLLHANGPPKPPPLPGARSQRCSAGALAIRGSLRQEGGIVSFQNCSSAAIAGGLLVEGALHQEAGAMEFLSCAADFAGGGLVVGGGAEAHGAMTFRNCTSDTDAAAHIQMGMNTSGSLHFEDCFGEFGGALRISLDTLQILGGTHSFRNCVNRKIYREGHKKNYDKEGGAAIHITQGRLHMLNGTVSFENCHSFNLGGAVRLFSGGRFWSRFEQRGGRMIFTNCSSKAGGGALAVSGSCKFIQTGGSLEFNNCYTHGMGRNGGGLVMGTRVQKTGGAVIFNNCSATGRGGGMFVSSTTGHQKGFVHTGGSLAFSSCQAYGGGGGFASDARIITVLGGHVSYHSCSSKGKGGGMMLMRGSGESGQFRLSGGILSFHNCSAESGGGGMRAFKFQQDGGHFIAEDCSARNGGGLFSQGNGFNQTAGTMHFRRCRAQETGGGVFSSSEVSLVHAEFDGCYAFAKGNAMFLTADADIGSVKITSDVTELSVATITGLKAEIKVKEADCSEVESCGINGLIMKVSKLYCKAGSGQTRNGTVCIPCPPSFLQPLPHFAGSCSKCPKFAKICTGERLKMLGGHMVAPSNISHAFHCPNVKACPGGYVPGHDVPMCTSGHVGEGCTACNETTHAISDGSVLSCVRCAQKRYKKLMQLAFAVVKDIVLFWVAVAGVRGADAEKKHSAVLLNQLMSFAAVASSSLSAVTQTGIFNTMRSELHTALRAANIAVELGGGSGGSGGGLAVQCLISYLGLPKTLWHAHLFSAVMPALLMASLALRGDPGLALVVGSNCFLPGFCADFGKYFVCFRVNKEKAGAELRCNFLPPGVPPPVLLATILICFIVAIVGWTRAAYFSGSPMPKHVMYLSNAYKPRYAAWETERLVRKMLLRLLCAVLPTTLSPALHMTGISLILLTSLGCYLVLSPYKVEIWNYSESMLLTVAAVMTCLSSCLLANDGSWGHSEVTQRLLLYSTIALASSVCIVMMVLIAIQMRQESASAKKDQQEPRNVYSRR